MLAALSSGEDGFGEDTLAVLSDVDASEHCHPALADKSTQPYVLRQ